MDVKELLSTEELCRKWPVEGPDPIKRWWKMLQNWRECDPARLVRHVHYELLYRDGFAVYAYSEPRVLHLIWHAYETSPHPLCVQVMLAHAPAIKAIVLNRQDPMNRQDAKNAKNDREEINTAA